MISETLKYRSGDDGVIYIQITEGDFAGIEFSYGKVWFPEDDQPILSFNYDLVDHTQVAGWSDIRLNTFENLLGELLQGMLTKAMESEEVIYKGGKDENRRTDTGESSERRSIFAEGDPVP